MQNKKVDPFKPDRMSIWMARDTRIILNELLKKEKNPNVSAMIARSLFEKADRMGIKLRGKQ